MEIEERLAMQNDDPEFKKHFFGARENITDSYQILKSEMVLGLTGFFSTNHGVMLGHIVSNQDDNTVLRKYVLLANVSGRPSWLSGVGSDVDSNLHIMPGTVIPVLDTSKCIEVMDFEFIVDVEHDIRLVNISKIGTFWSLICNNRLSCKNT
ncbi:hypothetical protein MFLAVUS_010118 [Mucor flavus]|uniref:Uncharacterized protein n=1 Tax=Mucor flavus TaxID=439312 RepID=A0ABP9ZBU5_9FUNG